MDINENVFITGKLILTGSMVHRGNQMDIISSGPSSVVISASTDSTTKLATAYVKLFLKQAKRLTFGSTVVGGENDVSCLIGIPPTASRDPENAIFSGVANRALLIANSNPSGSIQFGINKSVLMSIDANALTVDTNTITINSDKFGFNSPTPETDLHLANDGSVFRIGNSSGSINIDDGNLLSQYSGSIQFCEASTTGSMDHGVTINFTSSQTPDGFNPAYPRMSYLDIRGHSGSVDGTVAIKIPKDGKKIGFGNFPIDKMPEAQTHIYAGESSTTFANTTFAIENTGALQADFAMHVVTNPGTAFCIKNNGDVGIGKSDPNYALEVGGTGDLYAHDWVGAGNYFYVGQEIRHSNDIDNKIVFGGDIQQFLTSNQTRLKIDSLGHVTKPWQPCFRAKGSSTQSDMPLGTWTKINFASEKHDTNADYSTGTSTFTAPVDGKYYFFYALRVMSLDTDATYVYVKFNVAGVQLFGSLMSTNVFSQDVTYFPIARSIILDLDANDSVYLEFYQSGGVAQTDISSDSEWGGYLIG